MKAAVVVPPLRDFYRTRHRHSALGPHVAASLLEQSGVDISFYHFPVQGKRGHTIPVPKELGYLKPYILPRETGPVSFFTGYRLFGPDTPKCGEIILRNNPDIVFLSCFAFCYARDCLDLAMAIKRSAPEVIIAAGGAGVSAFPEYFISTPWVDFAFTGEIEHALPRFIRHFSPGTGGSSPDFSGVPGLHYKGGKNPPDAPEPIPGFSITRENGKECYVSLSLTRGCPKQCRFCSVHLSQGSSFRKVPLGRVEALFNNLPAGKKVVLNFEDDNILADEEYVTELLSLVSRILPGAGIKAENGIDYMFLSESMTVRLIESGMTQFNLSLGAVPPNILEAEDRSSNITHYRKICRILEENHIPLITYFICGLASDTPGSVAETLLFLSKQNTLIGISLFYPVPGLKDFQDRSVFDDAAPFLSASSSAFPWNRSLSTAQMITAFRLTRFINLLKKKHLSGIEEDLVRKSLASSTLHTLINTGGSREIIPVPNLDTGMQHHVLSALLY